MYHKLYKTPNKIMRKSVQNWWRSKFRDNDVLEATDQESNTKTNKSKYLNPNKKNQGIQPFYSSKNKVASTCPVSANASRSITPTQRSANANNINSS